MTDHDPTRREFLGLTGAAGASAVLGGLLLPEPARAADPAGPPAEFCWQPHWEVNRWGDTVFRWDAGETLVFPVSYREGADCRRWYIRCGGVWWRGEDGGPFVGTLDEAKRRAELFTAQTLRAALVAVDKVAFAVPGR